MNLILMDKELLSIVKIGAYFVETSFLSFDTSLKFRSVLNFCSYKIFSMVRHHLITHNYPFCAFKIAI